MPGLSAIKIKFKYKGVAQGSYFTLGLDQFTVPAGDFRVILGPNGAGKSTLLKLLSGALKPEEGNIFCNGSNLLELSEKERAKTIAYVPQLSFNIQPVTIYNTVMMGRFPFLNFWGFEKAKDKKIVNELISLVGLSGIKDKNIDNISGGELQRTLIARALAQEPEILLMDEPNANLDIEHQISVFNLFQQLNLDRKITIVVISHDLNLAANYAKTATLMKEGMIVCNGTISEVVTTNNIKNVFNVNTDIEIKNNRKNIQLLT